MELRLKPFLYKEECEKHGLTNYIVEQQEILVKEKKISFVFYCKKCWLKLGNDCTAYKATLTYKEYNDYFGFYLDTEN